MAKADWIERYPTFPWLAANDPGAVGRVLRETGVIAPNERVDRVEKAGEGNMNLTLRVAIARGGRSRSVIVKQSRPWVEKYDAIDAPWDRANVEAAFYERVANLPEVARRMPKLLGADRESRVLVLEDLGRGSDFFGLYLGEALEPPVIDALGGWLRALHDATHDARDERLANREMRRLNHAHIFQIPLNDPPPLDLAKLAPDVPAAAADLRGDAGYRRAVAEAGERYLADGDCLLHGDFFPGSWMRTDRGMFVIDPEFCFFGDREFDLGVAVAHFALARRPVADVERFFRAYGDPGVRVDRAALSTTAGIEVMRRLIGVAQLPLGRDLDRAALLRRSRDAVVAEDWRLLWRA
jgi:5-methylthioribose kinase